MKWKVLVSLLAFNFLFANSNVLNLLQRYFFKLGECLLVVFIVSNVVNAKIVKDLKSYEDACLDSIAWDKVTILVPENFYRKYKHKILKEIPKENECKLKDYDPITGKVNFAIVEKNQKKYYQITFKAVDWWEMDASDLVAEKEKEVKRTEKEVKRTEEEVKRLENMAKVQGYLGYLQKKVIFMGNHIENKKLINDTLDEVLSNLKINDLRGSKYAKNIKKVLDLIRIINKDDKYIVEKVDNLLNRLKLD